MDNASPTPLATGHHDQPRIGLLLVAHPVVLILADRDFAAFFDPRVNFLRAMALSFAMAAILALVVLSVARRRLALAYEWWRVSHALLAAMLMLVALAHTIMVGHYTASIGIIALMGLYTLGPLAVLGYVRILAPMRRAPWHVTSVNNECERVWTVQIQAEPPNPGIRFEPGQFAWLTFGNSPFHPRQHPFSIASSAGPAGTRQHRLAFTIKELGDFTDTIGSLKPGTRAWVDGPVGGFVLPDSAPGAVLIAGGIGITPMMSNLRTMADRGDTRPITLIYANATLEKAAFAEELDQLTQALALRVVHVPEQPPEGRTGPSGFINQPMLATLLTPEAIRAHTAMVCGPVPMIKAVHQALVGCGVHRTRIKSERFDMLA